VNHFRNVLTAMGVALLVGVAAGWLRYWIGFVVIFHGAACAGIIGWLFHRVRPIPAGNFDESNAQAWRWSFPLIAIFWLGQFAGTGLAQPWFDPLDYYGGILAGKGIETFLAMGQVRSYGGGMSGFMWAFCVLLDAVIMLILTAVFLRDDEPGARHEGEGNVSEDEADEEEENEDGESGKTAGDSRKEEDRR